MPLNIFILRSVAFVALAMFVFNGIWWLATPLFLLCLFYYNAYEFIFMAFCIDVYFAPEVYMLYYTMVATFSVLIALWLRPRLRA